MVSLLSRVQAGRTPRCKSDISDRFFIALRWPLSEMHSQDSIAVAEELVAMSDDSGWRDMNRSIKHGDLLAINDRCYEIRPADNWDPGDDAVKPGLSRGSDFVLRKLGIGSEDVISAVEKLLGA